METFKKIGKRILYPPLALMILLIPVSAALLLWTFLSLGEEHPISYVSYVCSAYTLTVWCMKIPSIIRWGKRVKQNNRYVQRVVSDVQFRVKWSLFGSVIMNLAYAIFQFWLGIYHGSFWFHSLALYYLFLVLMRFFLLRDIRGMKPGENMACELRRYRFCGVVLLVMTQALTGMVFFITYFGRGVTHHPITTIAMAAYTFTSLTMAIVSIVRYRRYHSPLLSASKAINLAAATVSMLMLETAMFSAFGDGEALRGTMTLLTGIGVCLFVMAIAISMIVHGTKELKKLKNEEQ